MAQHYGTGEQGAPGRRLELTPLKEHFIRRPAPGAGESQSNGSGEEGKREFVAPLRAGEPVLEMDEHNGPQHVAGNQGGGPAREQAKDEGDAAEELDQGDD